MSDLNVGRAAFLKVRKLLDEAGDIAFAEVERRARKALKGRPQWGFCMAMGSATFFNEHDTYHAGTGRQWMASTFAFIDEYDSELKLTGRPLKLTSADGPRITDW